MNLGYHTAGLLLHDEATAINELAKIGYQTVAIRPRRGSFNPLDQDFPSQAKRISDAVKHAGVELVIDANSYFIHDVKRPIEPSLVSSLEEERQLAANWIRRLIDVARELPASSVVISSGAPDESAEGKHEGKKDDTSPLDRLAEQLNRLSDYSSTCGVGLMLRPASKTFVTNVAGYERVQQWLRPSSRLGLAADIGEMIASGELPVSERLSRNANFLGGVFLRDAAHGSSGDQRIGYGEINLGRILASLSSQGFLGWAMVCVEGHEKHGLCVAEEAFELLKHCG
jgi:sugar phosphate isomerase/epimerase